MRCGGILTWRTTETALPNVPLTSMHDTAHLMEAALRVLAGVSVRRSADPRDVEELVKFAGPQPEGMDLDEFACTVIQKILLERAEVRRSAQA